MDSNETKGGSTAVLSSAELESASRCFGVWFGCVNAIYKFRTKLPMTRAEFIARLNPDGVKEHEWLYGPMAVEALTLSRYRNLLRR